MEEGVVTFEFVFKFSEIHIYVHNVDAEVAQRLTTLATDLDSQTESLKTAVDDSAVPPATP